MRNMIDAYAKAVTTWAATLSTNAVDRTVSALDMMRQGNYSTEELMQDLYEYWRDLADFRAQATLGWIPSASLTLSAWAGTEVSNFVQIPVVPLADLALTPVVNAATNTQLVGLELDTNNGENFARVRWVAANAGGAPGGPADRRGLFQGAIYRVSNNELIAPVYARTQLP